MARARRLVRAYVTLSDYPGDGKAILCVWLRSGRNQISRNQIRICSSVIPPLPERHHATARRDLLTVLHNTVTMPKQTNKVIVGPSAAPP